MTSNIYNYNNTNIVRNYTTIDTKRTWDTKQLQMKV